ncbi:maleylpyruvate isomerase family mycothiol-dependent enzyme [Nocardia asteroides]|uniref:maleylpyruvate isomerase family mycothiol-dependent enzyme n=1 Tax=Nocardia asteroides TaxID=1824 RepID=UPI001E3C7E01|nr:maleylpyruvate isomerase family mycothiol-dependent enzyme [Nocardia asteroides]UGT59446.1 maleylpyruvate isomerase family mycothiol-dependent enzyme [Nocardia asteroides]
MTDAAAPPPVPEDLAAVAAATRRFLDSARELTDADLAEPSLLPGWTRGHLLTHVARNADSLVNLLTWARTGIETPQYPDPTTRDAEIAAGAARPIAEQYPDNEAAAARWADAAAELPPTAWTTLVRNRQGREFAGAAIGWMRLQEVEIHHVDLAFGYTSADWPADFVARLLPEVVATHAMNAGDRLAFEVRSDDIGFGATIGAGAPGTLITGPAHALLAWLLGRGTNGLTGDLPELPSWR